MLFATESEAVAIDDPPPAKDAAAAAEPSDAAVSATNEIKAVLIEGDVERLHGDGSWVPVAVGEVLAMTDEVRTGLAGQATFSIGTDTSVEVAEATSLAFLEISDAVSKIRLRDGRVAATSEGRKVRVEVKNSDAVAESDDGSFAVLTEGEGNVTVASKRGEVVLSAQGESVKVGAGTQSIVRPNAAPSKPTEIPSSLFLKVRRPRADAQLQSAMLEGKASPGSVINIRGDRVSVGSDGIFKKKVQLGVGSRDIRVTVVDASGRRETQAVRVITPKANTKGMVEW
jgi:hypothetical protein